MGDRVQAFRLALAAVFLAFATAAVAGADPPLFEIVPQEDDRVPFGRLAVIEGATHPDGVRLVIRNLTSDQPVQVTLIADDDDLTLQFFTQDWSEPLMETETEDGEATVRFRTSNSAQLLVSGDEEERYQLFAWVGPSVEMPPPSMFMTSEEFEDSEGGSFGTIFVLIVLGAGAYFYMKRRSKPPSAGTAAVLFLAVSLGTLLQAPLANAKTPEDSLKPKTISAAEQWKQLGKGVNDLREKLSKAPKTGVKPLDDATQNALALIAFVEQTGFIDPREAAVQANYRPDGQPPLPSRCYSEPRGDCAACFETANGELEKWRKLLEDLWVIYKKTEMEAGRIIELADAAAGMSPLANFVWQVSKSNPNEAHVKSQAAFYKKYDENYTELIKRLNDGLIEVGNCEQKHFDDDDWYNRYGLPFYLFMRDRYQRK